MDVDLSPVEMECMRCRRTEPMRFYGVCSSCRDELRRRFDREEKVVETQEYVPKMNVTPNAVAVKDD